MLSRENVTREALSALEAQRAANLMEEKRRRIEAEEKSSAVAELLAKRQRLFFSGMRGAFASPDKAKEISQNMQTEMEQLKDINRTLLIKLDQQYEYIKERDQQVMELLQEYKENKQLLLEIKEEQHNQGKKGWRSWFNKK